MTISPSGPEGVSNQLNIIFDFRTEDQPIGGPDSLFIVKTGENEYHVDIMPMPGTSTDLRVESATLRAFKALKKTYSNKIRDIMYFRGIPNFEWRDNICHKIKMLHEIADFEKQCAYLEEKNINVPDKFKQKIRDTRNDILGDYRPIQIETTLDEPKQSPDDILEKVAKLVIWFPKAKGFNVTYKDQRGADYGGLSRQFISDLFEGIVTNSEVLQFKQDEQGLFFPVLRLGDTSIPDVTRILQVRFYKYLSVLMIFCYREGYPIGQVFSEQVFRGIIASTNKDIRNDRGELIENSVIDIYREMIGDPEKKFIEINDPEILSDAEVKQALIYAMDYDAEGKTLGDEWYGKSTAEIRANYDVIRNMIEVGRRTLTQDISGRVKVVKFLAQEIDVSMSAMMNKSNIKKEFGNDPIAFSKAIQGEMNNTLILDRVELGKWVPAKVKDWFQSWLESADDAKKKAFLKAITGSPTITAGSNKKIRFERHGGEVLNIHSCGWQMDIPKAAVMEENRDLFLAALEGSVGGDEFDSV